MKSSTNPDASTQTDPETTNPDASTQTDPGATKLDAFRKTAPNKFSVSTSNVSVGQPRSISGQSCPTSGQPRSISGQSCPTSGQPSATSEQSRVGCEQLYATCDQSHASAEQLLSPCKQSHAPSEQSRATICGMSRSRYIAQAGVIAALYAAITLIVLVILQGLAWGPVQFRISEAICVVAALTPAAVPGLTAGCLLANLMNIAFSGVGALGLFDVVFGSCATLLGALFCWRMRAHAGACVLGFIIANAAIVPLYLPILVQGLGYYTIPFTTISLDGFYGAMYVFGLIATGIGEAIVMYVLGEPLLAGLKRAGLAEELIDRS